MATIEGSIKELYPIAGRGTRFVPFHDGPKTTEVISNPFFYEGKIQRYSPLKIE